jgi:hypothetical protein
LTFYGKNSIDTVNCGLNNLTGKTENVVNLIDITIVGGVSFEPAGGGCQLLYCARLVKVRFENSKCLIVF